jgi:hypothetical protein
MHPWPSQLTLTPDPNDTSQGGDDQSITSPSTDSQAGDSLIARNSTPSHRSHVPPKRRLHLLSDFLKSRDNYTASAPSTPAGLHTTRVPDCVTVASGDTKRPSPSQLTLTPDPNGTSQGRDDQYITSPSTDSQAGDSLIARNSTPSPVPPKRRLHLLSDFLKSRDNHTASAPFTPTYAAASQLSLPLNHPGSPSKPHRGKRLIPQKLFGHKGKERSIDPDPERPPEPLETWDMLSDVERDVPPASSIPNQSPFSPRPLAPGPRLEPQRLLNHRVLSPPLPLASTGQRHLINSSTDVDDNPTRGRTLRATSSLVWASGRRNSPVPSRTRTVTAPTSPSTASLLSIVANANVDHDTDTHAFTVTRDASDPEGAVPPSPVQEEEEEGFLTPPGSPVRSLAAHPPPYTSTHPSPVQYSVNGAQLGQVQGARRRVTHSGRVKLKLVLLGTTVDRCVVCKMQFQDNDSAALGTRCEHA